MCVLNRTDSSCGSGTKGLDSPKNENRFVCSNTLLICSFVMKENEENLFDTMKIMVH